MKLRQFLKCARSVREDVLQPLYLSPAEEAIATPAPFIRRRRPGPKRRSESTLRPTSSKGGIRNDIANKVGIHG